MRVDENKAKVLAKYYLDHYLFLKMSFSAFDERKDKLVGLQLNKIVNLANETLDIGPKENSFCSIKRRKARKK